MVNAQEWLEKYYPNKWTEIIYLNQQLEGVLDCSEYKNLREIYISSSVDGSKLEIKKSSYWGKETEIINCIPAQTRLNQKYYGSKRKEEETHLFILGKGWEGDLDLSGFKNLVNLTCPRNCLTSLNLDDCKWLEEVDCKNNQLTFLNLTNLKQLRRLNCSDNYLIEIIYPTNTEKIIDLQISNNNFPSQDLAIFSKFRNLRELSISNYDENKISQGIYNCFYGSLEPLKDLNNLLELHIYNTDINSGIEYLPDNLRWIGYETKLRSDCKLVEVKEHWDQEFWKDIHDYFAPKYKKSWLEAGFSKEQTREWINTGFEPNDYKFVSWLRDTKHLTPEKVLNHCNLEQLNQEFSNWQELQAQIQIPPKK